MTIEAGQDSFIKFLPHPRIVAIDNKDDDLNLIAKGLFNAGLPCVTMLYDIGEGLKMPSNWEASRLRIIFLDLNLREIEDIGRIGSLIEPICDVLKDLSPAGPYLLVFWTKHEDQVKRAMKTLTKRGREVRLPVSYETLDKTLFTDPSRVEDLKKGIIDALVKNRVFLAMLAWESEVEGAAVRTFDRLHSLVEERQSDGTSLKATDLKDLLKRFAVEAWGKVHAKENPGAAVTSGLSPLLSDHLDAITSNPEYSTVWEKALSNGWNRRLPKKVTPAQLHSHCLVDLSSRDTKCRGAWLEFTDGLRQRQKTILGQNLDTLIEEFINPENAGIPSNFREKVRLGLVECSAACDIAQDKAPLRRYILCARIPAALAGFRTWKNPDRQKKHDAIYKLETTRIDSEDFDLLLDFRYTLSLPPNHRLIGRKNVQAIFRVRSQVLAHISAEYAFHTTRPGIFSFHQ